MGSHIDHSKQQFVSPYAPQERLHEQLQYLPSLPEQEFFSQAAAFTAMEGAQEKTSGVDRAVGLLIRLLPSALIWVVLSLGVAWLLDSGDEVVCLLFALLMAATYWRLNEQEFKFSRHGVERHKLEIAARLSVLQMNYNQELRREVLRAHLKILAGEDVHDRQALEVPRRILRQLTHRG